MWSAEGRLANPGTRSCSPLSGLTHGPAEATLLCGLKCPRSLPCCFLAAPAVAGVALLGMKWVQHPSQLADQRNTRVVLAPHTAPPLVMIGTLRRINDIRMSANRTSTPGVVISQTRIIVLTRMARSFRSEPANSSLSASRTFNSEAAVASKLG